MSPTRHSNVKILVIDDDTSMLAFLKLHLQKAGYVVLLAEDGIVGGRLALSASPDLILLDVQMPYLNGYELVEALKVDPAARHRGAAPWRHREVSRDGGAVKDQARHR